ncbi:transporter, SSS family [Lachnoanaerobaculum sp. MSX33]|jgi:SSS family solute:Na+ symporter|uniref:sodium:solute symporter family protein n=1 Tax=unclassified Lachnoanaerobaculum TaxID=2625085 RepID=UPI0002824CF0|nr:MULTISPECIES: sodium:solute symporter family protein [unclassified Lachnoanaerobaculum]EJZ70496.1 solute:sodium symporter (SSS) family transporter [Lachnoanaerobaculum sp. OBRC5-5]ETO97181.1 transporter, SSS family [Lachnoanaerobaculum sp. MSX33]MDU6630030.1 sodium:solute symporter family protein [Lachnoanaerobaculum sp.]
MGANWIVTAVVIVYLIAMLFIGWYSSTKINSNTDFMVAGRRLGPFLMAGTLAATEIGGGSSLGVVQNGMSGYGLSAAWYIITMGIAFAILSFIAPKFRAATVKTVPEYFRRRYGKESGFVTAIIMLLPLIGLTAGQFIASSVILSTMLGISYKVSVIIVAVVVTIYSIMGGLWSVTLTDFVQVFLIILGMLAAVPFALNYAGGWSAVVTNVTPETMNLFSGYDLFGIISLVIMYVGTFSVGQEAVSRFYAAKNETAAKQGAWLAALLNFIYAFVPTILGIIVLALINMGKFSDKDFASVGARYALPILAIRTMPAIVCGLLFSGVISATMSSSDSDLLGAGSIFANDIYKIYIRPNAKSSEVMNVTKITMIIVGFLSLLIALFNTKSIVSILMFCFTLRAAGSFFPYVMGHYWAKASKAGTIASLIFGTIVVVYLEQFSKGYLFGIHFSQAIIPGLVFAFIGFVIFSIAFPPKNPGTELLEEEDD